MAAPGTSPPFRRSSRSRSTLSFILISDSRCWSPTTQAGGRTLYLSIGAESLRLLDDCADSVICRNALDHMPDPPTALGEVWRILRDDGAVFVSVDTGGEPMLDEPTGFLVDSFRKAAGRSHRRRDDDGQSCATQRRSARESDSRGPEEAGHEAVCSTRSIFSGRMKHDLNCLKVRRSRAGSIPSRLFACGENRAPDSRTRSNCP